VLINSLNCFDLTWIEILTTLFICLVRKRQWRKPWSKVLEADQWSMQGSRGVQSVVDDGQTAADLRAWEPWTLLDKSIRDILQRWEQHSCWLFGESHIWLAVLLCLRFTGCVRAHRFTSLSSSHGKACVAVAVQGAKPPQVHCVSSALMVSCFVLTLFVFWVVAFSCSGEIVILPCSMYFMCFFSTIIVNISVNCMVFEK